MDVPECLVRDCTSVSEKKDGNNITFYSFPVNRDLRNHWICNFKILNKQIIDEVPSNALVCSKHFSEEFLMRDTHSNLYLKPNSFPTLFPNIDSIESIKIETASDCESDDDNREIYTNNQDNTKDNEILSNYEQNTTGGISLESLKRNKYFKDVLKETPITPQNSRLSIKLKKHILKKSRKIKQMQNSIHYRNQKIIKLTEMVGKLENELRELENQLKNRPKVLKIQEPITVIEEIKVGKVQGEYPPNVRNFAITLYSISFRAYTYVKSVFTNLPCERTLRAWKQKAEVCPSITQNSLDFPKTKIEKDSSNNLEISTDKTEVLSITNTNHI